jgi:hypothetical protein
LPRRDLLSFKGTEMVWLYLNALRSSNVPKSDSIFREAIGGLRMMDLLFFFTSSSF